jgi:hypothetical protein
MAYRFLLVGNLTQPDEALFKSWAVFWRVGSKNQNALP